MFMERPTNSTCLLCGVVILTATVLFQPAGACMRAEAPPQQITTTTTTELPNFIRVINCTIKETLNQDCKYGECQSHKNTDDGSHTLKCQCEKSYTGTRCEKRQRPAPSQTLPNETLSASGIAVVVCGVVVGLVVIVVVVIVCRLRSRQDMSNERMRRDISRHQNGTNGAANGGGEGHESTRTNEETRDPLLEMETMKNNNTKLPPV